MRWAGVAVAGLWIVSSAGIAAGRSAADEGKLLALDEEVGEALVRRDLEALDRLLADDYRFTSPAGVVTTKAERVGAIRSGELVYKSTVHRDVEVRLHGRVAIVLGRADSTVVAAGRETSGAYRYLSVWVRDRGSWRAVATQSTRITE